MEFQAVLLAGGTGTRLYPMTEGVPKSMLYVANRPLIAYQLHLLEKAGFKDVLVATSKTAKSEMENYLSQEHKGSISVEIQLVDEDLETADVLRALKDKIRKDFVVVSGDLITDVNVHHLADVHRINDATCTVLLRAPKTESKQPGAAATKPGKAEGGIVDFVAIDEKRSRLLCLDSAADIEDRLVLPKALLMKHPNVSITNKMLDAHFYIFSRWILDLLEQKPAIMSIKSELIPYLLRHQFSKKPVPGQPDLPGDEDAEHQYDVTTPESKSEAVKRPFQEIRCHAYVYPGGYCSRADSLHSYREMNFEVPRHQGHNVPWDASSSFSDKSEEEKKLLFKKVGSDCVVAAGFSIGDKSSVKKSVIGKHCSVGNNVKIVNCIIHNHVKIEDNCNLTGCLISKNAYIGKDCTLTNCQVGLKFSVEAESEAKNENLVHDD